MASSQSTSAEDYLERIHELIERKGYARMVDIAEALEISQPSVTAMIQKLAEAGYLNYERYRGLSLTEKGRAVAENIQARHATLKRLLSLLGIEEATQERDIEGLEHSLSEETVAALADLAGFLENHPDAHRQFQLFQQRRREGRGPRRSR